MKLHSIAVENFRVLRRARLELPDQLIGIIGPNGAGKSSLVEALAWALYGGRVARSAKEEIRSTYAGDGEDCSVTLEFEIAREHYRLQRRLVGRTERPDVTLWRGGSRESSGSTETERYVTRLLGLDWRGFLTSFLARQQELNALADLAPGGRREQLAGMLGVDRLDRAIKAVKDDRRGHEQAIAMYEQQAAFSADLQRRVQELREHVGRLESQHVTLTGAWETASRRLAEREAEFREHQTRQVACSQMKGQLEVSLAARRQLDKQIEDLCSREKRLLAGAEELAGLQRQIADLEPLRSEMDELVKRRDAAARRERLVSQGADLKHDAEEIERSLAEQRSAQADLHRQLKDIPADLSDQLVAVTNQLETARRQWSEYKAELAAEERAASQLRDQLESIHRVGPDAVCERCRRPFGDDLPQIKEHLAAELEQVEKNCARHRSDLGRCAEEGEKLKAGVERQRRLQQTEHELRLRLESVVRQVADLTGRQERLTAQFKKLEHEMTSLGETEWDANRLEWLTTEIARLENVRTRFLGLEGELKALPETQENLGRLREQVKRAEEETVRIEHELAQVGFDQAAFDRLAEQLGVAQKEADQARSAHVQAEKELEIARRDIKAKEEELGRLAVIEKKLEQSRTDQFYAEKLVSLFGDFRKYTISRIRPRLAELSSQLMAEMSGGRYSLVELDEDYNLQVMDNGEYFGIDRFSGGEKDLASLCLRLAISLALTESAGLDRSFVILDEVFGSQDTGRRELIFESLANLKERFPQMILITHLDELKHKVEMLVELLPQAGGWSEVRVNGEVV